MAGQRRLSEVGISGREAEVLAALGERLSNAEIGARLFISVRTVESHVSSLLRKLQVDDRRALAAVAGNLRSAPVGSSDGPIAVAAVPPSSLTPFVGRVAERAALSAALDEHRLVTAVGPGGVGKTRLAWSVAAALSDRIADGVWYVDLVPVTDPLMIAPAIADVLGLGERAGSSAADSVLGWLSDRQTLLVLDNCEHLLDGIEVLIERLLAGSPGSRVLATSRARLLVPFERVFQVPGLSIEAEDGGPGDAVELFLGRAAAGGSPVRSDDPVLIERIAGVCRALDGVALAIELAAARYSSTGLDGLESGLADRLQLLTGGRRIDDRHRSLRSTLDWSYALLSEPERAVLRRVSVFAGPFTASAASTVLADWPPVPAAATPTILAGLADQSLLIAITGSSDTRYRALETIRQYGVDLLEEAGESVEARSRHLRWCLGCADALDRGSRDVDGRWRAAYDEVADELRTALAWAITAADSRVEAYRLAIGVAQLSFLRGMPGESQRRYEQAAELAADDDGCGRRVETRCRRRRIAESRRRRVAAASARRGGRDPRRGSSRCRR